MSDSKFLKESEGLLLFTLETPYKQILANPIVSKYLSLLVLPHVLAEVSPSQQEMSLGELPAHCQSAHGHRFPANQVLTAANYLAAIETKEAFIQQLIVEEGIVNSLPNTTAKTFLMGRRPKNVEKKPAILIVPGGGYKFVATNNEALASLPELEAAGYRVFVLNYRVAPDHYPSAQLDAVMAIQYLVDNAQLLGIDPDHIWGLGFSAGGHILATVAEHWEEYQLDFTGPATHPYWKTTALAKCPLGGLVLAYPRISYVTPVTSRTFESLTGLKEENNNWALTSWLSVENHVKSDFPPTFLWACADDDLLPVGDHTGRFDKALTEAHIAHKTTIYPDGNHGCGRGIGTSAEAWLDDAVGYMTEENGRAVPGKKTSF